MGNPLLDFLLIPIRNPIFWAPLYTFVIGFYFFNFDKNRAYYLLLFTLLTVGTSDLVSSRVIKPYVERPRPCHVLDSDSLVLRVRCGGGYSFTSSHASNHFALAVYWMLVFFRRKAKWLWILFGWAFLISFAQIYVGVHYPSDVFIGSIIGSMIGLMTSLLYRKWKNSD